MAIHKFQWEIEYAYLDHPDIWLKANREFNARLLTRDEAKKYLKHHKSKFPELKFRAVKETKVTYIKRVILT